MGSFALIQPGVPTVPNELTPFHSSLQQKALKGIAAQEPELLQAQQTYHNDRRIFKSHLYKNFLFFFLKLLTLF